MNDQSGRPARAVTSTPKIRLPPLSQAFLSEEDAAFWVHTRIPKKLASEHGSLILLRPDGKYVATSPVPAKSNTFDFSALIERDASGNPEPPGGYRFVATLHSHIAAHAAAREHPELDERDVRLLINFFSRIDFKDVVDRRADLRSAYLSGPDGTLLKYSPSGSQEELDYYRWHEAGAQPGPEPWTRDALSFINRLAIVGELKVIVSNADWGFSVGMVPPDWRPGHRFSTSRVTELPLMTRVCANAERAVLAALKSRGALTAGLVLKKLTGNQYVATHARATGLAAWDAERVFPVDANGRLQLPAGYLLEGFYFASRPDPTQFPSAQPWLYENFFTPQEIALAIEAFGRSKHLAKVGQGLSLYMQAQDQSMLKYSFSGDPVEAALSVVHPDGTIGDNGVQSRLLAGTLRPREFVSMLVLAGGLEVLRGSALWARLGPVDLQWQPFAHFTWPVLSREFLSADDAARYAHDEVGIRRDREYVGYIFQRSDNRFVASEPMPGDIETLRQGQLYPADNHGRAVYPDEHILQARYVSHVALSQLDRVHIDYLRLTPWEALLSLQMFSIDETRQALFDGIVLYGSGARDSLIRFTPSTSPAAQDLEKRLGTRRDPGTLVPELESGDRRPEAFVRAQAAAGELVSLMDNPVWGYRGPVLQNFSLPAPPVPILPPISSTMPPLPLPSPWLPKPSLAPLPAIAIPIPFESMTLPWKRPGSVTYGAVFASADEAAQSQHTRELRLQDANRAWFGFILKHRTRDEFIATELIPVNAQRDNLFRLESVFASRHSEPWYQFPEGFVLYGSFYSHQWMKRTANDAFAWLAQFFMTPDDLTVAMYYSPRRSVILSGLPVALYIATRDGALLKFVPARSNKLFRDATSAKTLATFKADLASAKSSPSDYVHAVAGSGELSVMCTSLCWDRPGRVTMTWRPYANAQRRWLGPVFHSADDAAVHAGTLLPSIQDRTFGGLILSKGDGLFVATAPIEVSSEDFDITEIIPDEMRDAGLFPVGCSIKARYRSRIVRELSVVFSAVQKQSYLNMLSVDTVYSAFTRVPQTNWDEYLFAPDGSLIRYHPGVYDRLKSDLMAVLTDYKTVPAALDARVIKQRLRSGDLKPGQWIDSLAKSGDLHVVTGSDLWGMPRQVSRWVPFSADLQPVGDYTQATRAPVCSPIFVQADGAARYVHEANVSRATQTFGFILHSNEGLFLATVPVTTQRSGLAVDRVFEQGKLLSGYSLDAIYLRAALPPAGALPGDLRNSFISPSDVQLACRWANTPQGYKPIYVSCADGALLRLQLHPFEPGDFYDRFGQVELRRNTFVSMEQGVEDERDIAKGTFSSVDYVHRMARAGQLDVIETSDYWSRHGRVQEDWQPRQADVSAEQRWRDHPVPALGPVFNHPDDAARYAHQRVTGAAAIDTGYEGAILAPPAARRFVPLEPIGYLATEASPLVRLLRKPTDPSANWRTPGARYPEGYSLVATHQFHLSGNTALGQDVDKVHANFASPSMVLERTHQPRDKGVSIRDYYYSTMHDVLIKYAPVYSPAERELLMTQDVAFEGGRWISRLSPGEFLTRLVELGDFRVLIAGFYWHQTGRMGSAWRTRRQQAPAPGTVRRRDEL
ncbi:DUF4329 domain-containing protein [Pseudomonas sp. SWRI153]|uniref:DUF4329 domain-containing protein n=1 Tax=Pseudomonas khorasanensis TaxID=2745508 RepID=A0A923JFJ1_9PSED|nr:DUF4329 domain-containing protein [Pseudomonas khorasanensis]MBV4486465.1 DUF4329 domain-containing protein [Pseudomonas khorasanensis]